MRATGVTRRLDKLGRITLPMELRRNLEIGNNDLLEIYVDGGSVVLRKKECACMLCGQDRNILEFKSKLLCRNCLKDLRAL